MEQGFKELLQGQKINDAIRTVNNEGWDVIQVFNIPGTVKIGLLLQRQPRPQQ